MDLWFQTCATSTIIFLFCCNKAPTSSRSCRNLLECSQEVFFTQTRFVAISSLNGVVGVLNFRIAHKFSSSSQKLVLQRTLASFWCGGFLNKFDVCVDCGCLRLCLSGLLILSFNKFCSLSFVCASYKLPQKLVFVPSQRVNAGLSPYDNF